MMIKPKRVIAREVRMEERNWPSMPVRRVTRVCTASNMVWRQVKATVKPMVTMIKRRIWRRNSCLKRWPPMKKSWSFRLRVMNKGNK